MTQCPKCGHFQDGESECEACGIIFEKYAQHLARQMAAAKASEGSPANRSHSPRNRVGYRWLTGIGVSLVFVFLMFVFFLKVGHRADAPHNIDAKNVDETASGEASVGRAAADSISAQLKRTSPAHNAIESARNATVFIKTPIGIGSGFLVDHACDILTNRHVVEMLDKQREALVEEQEDLSVTIANLEQRIALLIKQYRDMGVVIDENNPPAPIPMNLRALRWAKDRQAAIQQVLDQAAGDAGAVEILLVDGSRFDAVVVDISDAHDLALLKIDGNTCPCLEPGSREHVQLGQKIYAIGNPSGLGHTVTAGIISGYRQITEEKYFQIDAPINPGNSGGPLIDEQGRVIGINTMILKNTEGIGFAIPIDVALDAFSDYLADRI